MKITAITEVHGAPYITRGNLAKQIKLSVRTIDARIKEMREETDRYDEFALIKDGGIVLINYLAWIDFMKYRERLMNRNLRKNIPKYDPKRVAESIGWYCNDGDTGSVKKILRYTDLVNRRMWIVLNSGMNWKPEYEREMKAIDIELVRLREEIGLEPIALSGS